jgi:KipI family sensor histidine kinase inhibitor
MADPAAPPPYDISPMGEGALLLHCAPPLDLQVQETVWQIARAAAAWPGVREAVPGVNNLLVIFDPLATNPDAIARHLGQAWAAAGRWTEPSKLVEVPVLYGGRYGPDLPELSALTSLPAAEIIRLHAAGTYVVVAIGSLPGFGYLAGLDPRLAMPRRATPRLQVEAGSVAIGGAQTAVLTTTSPSGWNVIGHTDTVLFDVRWDRPSLLAPGDRVRFVVKEALA